MVGGCVNFSRASVGCYVHEVNNLGKIQQDGEHRVHNGCDDGAYTNGRSETYSC